MTTHHGTGIRTGTIIRTGFLALLALPLLSARAGIPDEVVFAAEEGTTLVRTFESRIELELDEMSVTMNDEEVPAEFMEQVEWGIVSEQTVVVTDVYGELGDGRPLSLERSIETAEGAQTFHASSPDGDQEDETPMVTALEGRALAFTWDEDDEEYAVAFADDGAEDDDLLADLREDMDLRSWLPDGDVDEGDSWEIDVDDFDLVSTPGGIDLEPEDESDEDDELDQMLDDNTTGEVEATYQGTREVDGVTVAVIFVTAEVETEAEQVTEEEGAELTTTTAMGYELEGELLWNLDAGHLFGVELTGEMRWSLGEEATGEGPDGEAFEFVQLTELAGDLTVAVSVERD